MNCPIDIFPSSNHIHFETVCQMSKTPETDINNFPMAKLLKEHLSRIYGTYLLIPNIGDVQNGVRFGSQSTYGLSLNTIFYQKGRTIKQRKYISPELQKSATQATEDQFSNYGSSLQNRKSNTNCPIQTTSFHLWF